MLEILTLKKKKLCTKNHHGVMFSTLQGLSQGLSHAGVVLIDGTPAVALVRGYEQGEEVESISNINILPRSYYLQSSISNGDRAAKKILLEDGRILSISKNNLVFLDKIVEVDDCVIAVSPFSNDRTVIAYIEGHELHLFNDGRFFITQSMALDGWKLSAGGNVREKSAILDSFMGRHLYSRSNRCANS